MIGTKGETVSSGSFFHYKSCILYIICNIYYIIYMLPQGVSLPKNKIPQHSGHFNPHYRNHVTSRRVSVLKIHRHHYESYLENKRRPEMSLSWYSFLDSFRSKSLSYNTGSSISSNHQLNRGFIHSLFRSRNTYILLSVFVYQFVLYHLVYLPYLNTSIPIHRKSST